MEKVFSQVEHLRGVSEFSPVTPFVRVRVLSDRNQVSCADVCTTKRLSWNARAETTMDGTYVVSHSVAFLITLPREALDVIFTGQDWKFLWTLD